MHLIDTIKYNYKTYIKISVCIIICIILLNAIIKTTFSIYETTTIDNIEYTVRNANTWKDISKIVATEQNAYINITNTNLIANNEIVINTGQNIIIKPNSNDITITRDKKYKGIIFNNNGALTLGIQDNENKIIIDGNRIKTDNSALYINNANFNAYNIVLKNNYNKNKGGALYANNSTITINNSTITNNKASSGGGIFVYNSVSKLELNNVIVSNNRAINYSGGGIYAFGNIIIKDSSIDSNNARSFGGGLLVKNNATISDSTITNNNVLYDQNNDEGDGGGIKSDGNINLNNTIISKNIAKKKNSKGEIIDGKGGGISISNNKTLTIDNNTIIKDNEAGNVGGGVYFLDGRLNIISGSIENNKSYKKSENKKVSYNNTYPDINSTMHCNWDIKSEKKCDWVKDKFYEIDYIKRTYYEERSKNNNYWLQGIAANDDFIVMSRVKNGNEKTRIIILDRNNINPDTNTYYEYEDDRYKFEHANSITYNSNEDRFYITYNEKKIASFKIIKNKEKKYIIDDVKYITVDNNYYNKITYLYTDSNNDSYYLLMNNKNEAFIVKHNKNNNSLEFNNKKEAKDIKFTDNDGIVVNAKTYFKFSSYLTKQSIEYYKGYIYYSNYEAGHETSNQKKIYNWKEKNSNLIYVLDLKGNLVKTIYIPHTRINGELEDIAINNGTMFLGYNPTAHVAIYETNYLSSVTNIKLIEKPIKLTYNKGDEIDLTGGKIKVTHENGIEEEISMKIAEIKNNITGYNKNIIGKQTITINYNGKAASFDVTVNDNE